MCKKGFCKERNMTCKLIIRITFFLASIIVLPTLSLGAKDGAALYKSKCAHCHGTGGEGKPAMKAPALKGTTLTPDQIGQHITKGESSSKAPHNKAISGVNDTQAKLIAEFIKSLQ
jgi:mono/diheme cytochrome c family protein